MITLYHYYVGNLQGHTKFLPTKCGKITPLINEQYPHFYNRRIPKNSLVITIAITNDNEPLYIFVYSKVEIYNSENTNVRWDSVTTPLYGDYLEFLVIVV